MNESLPQPQRSPHQTILEQLGVLVTKISLTPIELQIPPKFTNMTTCPFFLYVEGFFEVLSDTDM